MRKPRKKIKMSIPLPLLEELISFKTAKLAKEKGCVINGTVTVYDADGNLTLDIGVNNEDIGMNNESYDAPTQSLVQKWLRDVHHIQIVIDVKQLDLEIFEYKYDVNVYSSLIEEDWENDDMFDTYELALEDALFDSLKLIKS